MALGNEKVIQIQLKLLDQISSNLSATITAMQKAEKEARELANEEKNLNSQNKAVNESLGTMGNKLLAIAGGYIGLSVAVNKTEEAIRYIIATGAEFEQSLANTRAILQPSAEDFAALSYEAFNLGKTTVFTAAQAGDAFTELGKLGFNTSQILSAGNDVLALAAATNVDMARAATVSATVLNQFNLEAGRTGEVVDTIAKAMNVSALDIDGFALSMKYVGPIAKQSGESIQATSAALGVLADNGLQGMTAGTGMRRVLTMLADGGSKASKAIAQVNPEAKTFVEKLEALKRMGMDTTMAVNFFGVEAQNAANILAQNTDKIKTYGDALEWVDGKAKGYAQTVADIQIDTFSGDVKLLTSNLEALGIQFFEAFGPQLRQGVKLLNAEVDKLSQWADENPDKLREWSRSAIGSLNAVLHAAEITAKGIEMIADALSLIAPEQLSFDLADEFSDAAIQTMRAREEAEKFEKSYTDLAKKVASGGAGASQLAGAKIWSEGKKREYEEQKAATKEILDGLKEEQNRLEGLVRMKVALEEEDSKRLSYLKQTMPAMELALQKEISFEQARKQIAAQRTSELKAQGQSSRIKTKSGDAPMDPLSVGVGEDESSKAQKAALASWEKLLDERRLIGHSAETKALLERQNYWNDLIETDKKGKGEHLAQLQKWKNEELELSLSKTPMMTDSFSMGNGRTISSQSLMMGINPSILSSFESPNKSGMSDEEFDRFMKANDAGKSVTELALKDEEFKFKALKSQREEFNLDMEKLTAEHEARMSEISRKEWEMRGAVMANFFGSMSQLLAAAGGENKKAAQFAKHLAVLEVAMNTAVAVSKVWSQTGIFGAMAIAAPIMSGAAQIAVIEGLHFAKGGIVPGQSYSGDNVQARVNSGEMVLNRAQQVRLFDIADGRANASPASNYTIHYSPTFAPGTSNQQIGWSQREFRREVRAMLDDPTFATTQGALA